MPWFRGVVRRRNRAFCKGIILPRLEEELMLKELGLLTVTWTGISINDRMKIMSLMVELLTAIYIEELEELLL